MNIEYKRRPWEKKASNGQRSTDRTYQTGGWKRLREFFRTLFTVVNGLPISNKYCIQCYREKGIFIDGPIADHIVPRRLGGKDEVENLQSLCDMCHAKKSAREGNETRKK
jgi:5-methylcytosine-specific restriction enzyme A